MMTQAEAPFTPPGQPLGLDEGLSDFELNTMEGQRFRSADYRGRILVVDFWSAECPISKKYDPYLEGFAKSYGPKGVAFLAIDSNVYEDEGQIARAITERGLTFPILRDRGNVLADYFGAETTPHLFVFDQVGRLRYRGAIDDTSFANKEVTVNYLEEAVDALLLDREVTMRESPAYGCTINRSWG